jgi:hypothetical protein
MTRRGTFRPVYGSALRLLETLRWRHSEEARELVASLYGASISQVRADAPTCNECNECNGRQAELPFG